MVVTSADISNAAAELGLEGRPLAVHSSLRSFGPVDGGARAVVHGLLGAGCTVVVPTFSLDYQVGPPERMRPPRNGWSYDEPYGDVLGKSVYTPDSTEMNRAMGAVPRAVLDMDGRVRGDHPLCSFAAVGPLATAMIEPQTPIDVFAPLRRVADTNGHYLLMGVDLTSMTAIHLAENMAGRNYFVRWALSSDGQPMMVFKGGCSEGFHKLEPFVEQTERRMTVGKSLWRSFPAHGLLRVATDAITQQPEITHCGRAGCKCDDAVLGGPILDEFPLEQA